MNDKLGELEKRVRHEGVKKAEVKFRSLLRDLKEMGYSSGHGLVDSPNFSTQDYYDLERALESYFILRIVPMAESREVWDFLSRNYE